MADQNSYVRYKRDTRHLLYWMIHASNSILNSHASLVSVSNATPINVNTTGQLPVSSFVPISKLIAEHVKPVPATIYKLFRSVIDARTAAHGLFRQIAAKNPDPEIVKSNASHKRFIEILTEAYGAIGGALWETTQQSDGGKQDDEDMEETIFANKFSSLNLQGPGDEPGDGDEEESDGPSTSALPGRWKKKKATGKGKKGKQKKKAKKSKRVVKKPELEDLPLESYRIIEDEDGLVTEYLMAVYSLLQQCVDLRQYVQGIWREVAYSGLNSAVAGTMSNMAIAMVKQAESAIFIDFPGHDSYETVMNTITRGDPEKAQGMFQVSISKIKPGGGAPETSQETDIDVKESFLIHAYTDLVDFLVDFQKNRSGKPTKSMQAKIANWDPNFDLQQASQEERIQWRRSYTINWLYDLVNVFSSIVVQRIKVKGQNIVLETVDWSTSGPWDEHRRLFGLNEFAGEITSLAMQKPATDIRPKILPHLVFQVQCIVDSLMVSRGWSVTALRGHIMSDPAQGFRPRRDVDLFMDREDKRLGQGYCASIDLLVQFLEKDAMLNRDPGRHIRNIEILTEFRQDFINWLGETKYMHGLTAIPQSRFSNRNGLWEYSPFLCGVGLSEALELAYSLSLAVWERMPEPVCVLHLHNMLVQKGYIKKEVGLYATLQELFPTAFFSEGRAPTSNFGAAFTLFVGESRLRGASKDSKAAKAAAKNAPGIHGILNPEGNKFFNAKSIASLYRAADWIPERIKDEDLPINSVLSLTRIGQTKQTVDPISGEKVLEDNALVIRARSVGITDETMIKIADFQKEHDSSQEIPEELLPALLEGYQRAQLPRKKSNGFSGRELLNILKIDIISEVSGPRPILSLNYMFVTIRFMILFHQFEEKLEALRNPLWVKAYEQGYQQQKRLALTLYATSDENDECLRVMAEAFENPRSGFMNHIYWDDLELSENMLKKDPLDDAELGNSCTVM